MSEHALKEIAREEGVSETRFHAVCTCGWLSGDFGVRPFSGSANVFALEAAKSAHKLHSEGKSTSEASDQSGNPGVDVWADRIEREGR